MTDRLYRHPTDRVIAGVAGGLAAWLNLDPSLVRVAWVLLALLSGGALVIVYIVMMIVVPLPPPGSVLRPRGSMGPGPGAAQGWQSGGAWDSGWSNPAGSPPPPSAGGYPPAAPGGAEWPQAGTAQPGWPPAPAGAEGGAPDPATGTWPGPASSPAPTRPGSGGLIAGAILVALGLWFLVDQYVRIDWRLLWPVLIMLAGGGLIAWAVMRGRTR